VNEEQPRLQETASPAFGPQSPTFGLVRDRGRRLEIVFAMRSGVILSVYEDADEDVTERLIEQYAGELTTQVAAGGQRSFSDSWGATGQRAWVNLSDVSAFAVRPAR